VNEAEAKKLTDAIIVVAVGLQEQPPQPLSPSRDFADEDRRARFAAKAPAVKDALSAYVQNRLMRQKPSDIKEAAHILDAFYVSDCGGKEKIFEQALGRAKSKST